MNTSGLIFGRTGIGPGVLPVAMNAGGRGTTACVICIWLSSMQHVSSAVNDYSTAVSIQGCSGVFLFAARVLPARNAFCVRAFLLS